MSSLPPLTARSQVRTVRLYGQPHSPDSYAIRDFLRRSVVEFEWIELPDNAESALTLGMPPHIQVQWPIVELPDGTRLFAPTIREIADRLGWVTQPRHKEYEWLSWETRHMHL
jgi:thioredoxin reductase (NADPH)